MLFLQEGMFVVIRSLATLFRSFICRDKLMFLIHLEENLKKNNNKGLDFKCKYKPTYPVCNLVYHSLLEYSELHCSVLLVLINYGLIIYYQFNFSLFWMSSSMRFTCPIVSSISVCFMRFTCPNQISCILIRNFYRIGFINF